MLCVCECVIVSVCQCVCALSQPSWDWQMESFHTQTERQGTGNRGVFNGVCAAVVVINLGQWRSAHSESASGASLAFT